MYFPDLNEWGVDCRLLVSTVATYKVFIRTGNRLNSGTDASVYMQIFGDLGDTGIIDLKQVMTSTRGQFSAGNECKFEMDTVDVGMVRIFYKIIVYFIPYPPSVDIDEMFVFLL